MNQNSASQALKAMSNKKQSLMGHDTNSTFTQTKGKFNTIETSGRDLPTNLEKNEQLEKIEVVVKVDNSIKMFPNLVTQ